MYVVIHTHTHVRKTTMHRKTKVVVRIVNNHLDNYQLDVVSRTEILAHIHGRS